MQVTGLKEEAGLVSEGEGPAGLCTEREPPLWARMLLPTPRAQIPAQAHTRTRAQVHTRACVRAHMLGPTPDGSDLWGGESWSWLNGQRDPQGPRGCLQRRLGPWRWQLCYFPNTVSLVRWSTLTSDLPLSLEFFPRFPKLGLTQGFVNT